MLGRPTGVGQLRGTFLPWWDHVLPARPREEFHADLQAVMERLVELAGGEIPGGEPSAPRAPEEFGP